MNIGVLTVDIHETQVNATPWIYHRDALQNAGYYIRLYSEPREMFSRRHDAIILHMMFNWLGNCLFDASTIMPILAKLATYRAKYPDCVNIVLHHWDMVGVPFSIPLWTQGDPVLYRTPFYDRALHYPFPAKDIWPYEKVWGSPCFTSRETPQFKAGFIGTRTSGIDHPKDFVGPMADWRWRDRVAHETAKVGIGVCHHERYFSYNEHNRLMSQCQILVCPKGYGQQSSRHWDAWLSGKPVLTDRACDAVEMIPGVKLTEGTHYLVFDWPEEIPDIVTHWTQPENLGELARIANNGYEAATSYDALSHINDFFQRIHRQS